ncbi:MAG TPA: bifunctional phosphopantothenoylcysteine decarboxylase/phosphopantothenate--cysteine ligase CoaBC [Desulfurivibrio alkaliphilus]|uniref:Coenzyme A biosynthesis bifunctional protein CoaBC n=1 Tax=Desulfurivibrio alkaliphilus TaxID=427923 RepID=A0A7C2TGB2_9BACT|nr:bifunctional phosphopantothenoylcysteine decarboxylase/phosphopantothenate--cysteine ligase CoaBC [Desulfurivibrio alkaliphilus]
MSFLLTEKRILLGISGGIAAYKTADWTRNLRREGAEVKVMMSRAAERFITPLTMAALSGHKVYSDIFAVDDAERIPHISLGRECDLILLAPATANTIARLAHGLADDLVTAVVLAAKAKVLICPAMNSAMYQHPATKANLAQLIQFGYKVVPPKCGELACGDQGPGHLVEWETVRQEIITALTPQDLQGKKVLVTAGPTWEALDPIRLLTSRASGKMGYALATAAKRRGAEVTLVSGPGNIASPAGVEVIPVVSAGQMHEAVLSRAEKMDVIIKAAAVSDYRPAHYYPHKIKKDASGAALPLTANPDILRELGERKKEARCFPLLIGFAAESDNHLEEGQRKLRAKNLDLIAINDISADDAGFAVDNNRVTLVDRNGAVEELPLLSKEEVAHRILNAVLRLN